MADTAIHFERINPVQFLVDKDCRLCFFGKSERKPSSIKE
jgi:hypothetical protein